MVRPLSELTLSEEQRRAATLPSSALAVVGAPGTGRTTALAARVEALATDEDHGPFLAVCPNPEAADRFRRLLGASTPEGTVTTIASLARQVLAGAGDDHRVASAAQVAEAISEVVASDGWASRYPGLAPLGAHASLAEQVTAAWEELDGDPDDLASEGHRAELRALRHEVEDRLHRRRLIQGSELLRRAAGRRRDVAGPFDHIAVDNAAEMDLGAWKLLAAMAAPAARWSLAYGPGRRPSAGPEPSDRVELVKHWRLPHPGRLVVGGHPSLEPELVAAQLLEAHRAGAAWSAMAVIVPSGLPVHPVARALGRHRIPVAGRLECLPTPLGRLLVDSLAWLGEQDPDPDRAPLPAGEAASLLASGRDQPAGELAFAIWERVVAPRLHGLTGGGRLGPDEAALDELTALMEAVEDHLHTHPRISPAELADRLSQLRATRPTRPAADAVEVVRPHQVAGRDWDTVVVTGCVEGLLPDLGLPAADVLGPTAPRRRHRWLAQRHQWALVSSRATRQLIAVAAPRPGALISRFVWTMARPQPQLPPPPGPPPARRPPTPAPAGVIAPGPLQLSASQLETYIDCPLRYAYDYGVRVRTPGGASVELGSRVHEVLARYLDPEAGEPRTRRRLLELAEEAWDDSIAPWRPQRHQLRSDYLAMLELWWETEGDPASGASPDVVAVEHRFEVTAAGHQLRGSIDRVDRRADGSVAIVDYKTGKRMPRAGEESLQLAAYQLAAARDPRLAAVGPVGELRLLFLRTMKSHHQPVTEDSEERTEAMISQLADQISAEVFEPRPGPNCRLCPYPWLCPSQPEGRALGTP